MSAPYFDEMRVGQLFKHELRRTITEADNVFFSALTHNPALLHLDEEYCRTQTEFGQRLVNSAFTLGLTVGISVGDTTLGRAVAVPLRHDPRRDRGARTAREQVPAERRHRHLHPPRLQSKGRTGGLVQALRPPAQAADGGAARLRAALADEKSNRF
jgi:acyl dehydratase